MVGPAKGSPLRGPELEGFSLQHPPPKLERYSSIPTPVLPLSRFKDKEKRGVRDLTEGPLFRL